MKISISKRSNECFVSKTFFKGLFQFYNQRFTFYRIEAQVFEIGVFIYLMSLATDQILSINAFVMPSLTGFF